MMVLSFIWPFMLMTNRLLIRVLISHLWTSEHIEKWVQNDWSWIRVLISHLWTSEHFGTLNTIFVKISFTTFLVWINLVNSKRWGWVYSASVIYKMPCHAWYMRPNIWHACMAHATNRSPWCPSRYAMRYLCTVWIGVKKSMQSYWVVMGCG